MHEAKCRCHCYNNTLGHNYTRFSSYQNTSMQEEEEEYFEDDQEVEEVIYDLSDSDDDSVQSKSKTHSKVILGFHDSMIPLEDDTDPYCTKVGGLLLDCDVKSDSPDFVRQVYRDTRREHSIRRSEHGRSKESQ